ncbi:toxin-antitoxin system YwqK family antitoxin [Pontibacter aquaedesilientis]|nr:hypothetical protein [Pontibacter aquaedesilientis]
MATAEPVRKKLQWPFKPNRYDKANRQHGMWKLYLSDNTTLLRKGRYRHGQERGKWRYYYSDGTIRKIEYHKPGSKEFLVKIFHDNGQLEKQGMAKVVETARDIHYFWFGTWQVYNRQGQFSHSEYYEKGNEITLDLVGRKNLQPD